jgi:hypothetical protein
VVTATNQGNGAASALSLERFYRFMVAAARHSYWGHLVCWTGLGKPIPKWNVAASRVCRLSCRSASGGVTPTAVPSPSKSVLRKSVPTEPGWLECVHAYPWAALSGSDTTFGQRAFMLSGSPQPPTHPWKLMLGWSALNPRKSFGP